jgi:hypothetical protein
MYMRNLKLFKKVFSVGLVCLMILPTILLAATSTPSSQLTKVKLDNPLNSNIGSIEELLIALLNIFITLMIPVIVFFIIYAGFKYVTAQGNPSKIEEAHSTLLYAIIGGVLILAAVAIAEIIKNTVAAF